LGTKINVKLNQVVKGGRTVLAELQSSGTLVKEKELIEILEKEETVTGKLSNEHGEPTLIIEHKEDGKAPAERTDETPAEPVKTPRTKPAVKKAAPTKALVPRKKKEE
jgi:phosphatidylserine decarboxylase